MLEISKFVESELQEQIAIYIPQANYRHREV